MPSLVEIGPVILEKIYNFFDVLISFGKALALQVNKIESPSPLCRLCEIGPVVVKKKWKESGRIRRRFDRNAGI